MAETTFWEIIIIKYFVLNLVYQILVRFDCFGLSKEAIDKADINLQSKWMFFGLNFFNQISTENVSRFKRVEFYLGLTYQVIFYILSIDVNPWSKLFVQKYRIDYVEHIFPNLKICHHSYFLHIDF